MNPFEQSLFQKGYCKLQQGSYHIWISKRWHEMFIRRGLVRKNFYGQFVPNRETLSIFIEWMDLYRKAEHDRDWPKSYKQLTPEEIEKIRLEVT
jgi:hypothetical protein